MGCGNGLHRHQGGCGCDEPRGHHWGAGTGCCCESGNQESDKAERKEWLESAKRRLETRLADVNAELTKA